MEGLSSKSGESAQRAEFGSRADQGGFARVAIVAALYFLSSWFIHGLHVQPSQLPIFWPQTGLALGAFIALPPRLWLWSAAVIVLAGGLFGASIGSGAFLQSCLALSDVFGGLIGGYVYRKYRAGVSPLNDLHVLQLFLMAATGVAVFSSLVRAAIAGQFSLQEFWVGWGTEFGAAAVGIALITLPIIGLLTWQPAPLQWRPSLSFSIAAALALLATVVAQFDGGSDHTTLARISLPFLVWVAIRHSAVEAVGLLVVISLLELWMAGGGYGWAIHTESYSIRQLLLLQFYLTLRAGTIFMLCAVMRSRIGIEDRAEQYAARLESMIEAVPDAIITIGERGVITFFSPAAERMFLYRADEAIGQNVKMLMPMPYRAEHDSYLDHYLTTGEKKIIGIGRVVVAQRKDGTTFPIELAVGEALSQGQHTFTGLIRDISEKQNTERRLHELQSDLLHVSRLSAMGELASALAHELNQPLTAINNYLLAATQLLQRGTGNLSRSLEIIGKSIDQAVRAGQIIRQLRNFVQRREVEREPVDIDKVIDESSALAFVGLKEKGIRVLIERSDDTPVVWIDRIQIQQVLINLIRNAVDAMETAQRRELTIRRRVVDGTVEISVIDTGSGISPEVADKLFQPFTSTKPSGMGVGLSISRTIIEAHDGRLRCEPNPAGGTIFHVTLPYNENSASLS